MTDKSPGRGGIGVGNPKKRKELPPLFWYMETSDWDKASDRVRRHPREVKVWATLKTKGDHMGDPAGGSGGSKGRSTKRLALHHACFKLRSAGSLPVSAKASDDPFVQACRFILLLIRLYPEACGQRESRHGCLPLHLASFASCVPRSPAELDATPAAASSTTTGSTATAASTLTSSLGSGIWAASSAPPGVPGHKRSNSAGSSPTSVYAAAAGTGGRPGIISRRIASDATTGTMETNMSLVHAEETYTGNMGEKGQHSSSQKNPNVFVAMKSSNIPIPSKREEMAVQVINALLDAYPKGIRVDSEGGRLPLHTACAGRATPRVVSTLVTAYPSAARHRNKDGFLPLHLAAHWGVSHPNVAITLLKSYPDATVGRNRWERTPLEEALVMAGENGRPHQAALVRALRKHPNYWAHPPPDLFGERTGRPIDMDESLPSNDTSTEDEERKYLRYGQNVMIDPE